MGTRIEEVRPPLLTPGPDRGHAVEHAHQRRRTIDHGSIDDLTFARRRALDECRGDAKREKHAASAKVAHQIQRWRRLFTLATNRLERASQRDVIDVVTRGVGHRPFLAPTRHASVDEPRIPFETNFGTEAEALHDTRPKSFDDHIGLLDESQHDLDAFGFLQIDSDTSTTTGEYVSWRFTGVATTNAIRPIDPDDLGAHVRKHHPAEGTRANPRYFQDFDSSEGSVCHFESPCPV
jgi:hypothetical protein